MPRGKRKYQNAEMIAKNPLDSEAANIAVEGAMLKQVVREKAIDELDKSIVLTGLGKFARESLSVKNFPIRELQQFSLEPSDWGVSFYFPVAKDERGNIVPTYVDAPQTKRQIEVCKKKAKWFEAKGLRYFVILPDERITPENIRAMVSPGSMDSMTNDSRVEVL